MSAREKSIDVISVTSSKARSRKRAGSRTGSPRGNRSLSARTKKQIDTLPQHAQHIYEKAHAYEIEQYKDPSKRRGGKKQSAEKVAHKTAWAAVKRKYTKEGDK